MKIIPNIPGAVRLYLALPQLTPFKREIESAKKNGDYERERLYIYKAVQTWSNHVLHVFGSSLTVYGKENLPETGPVVFVGNHQSYSDIVVYFAALNTIPFGYVARNELARIPAYGAWMRRVRGVFIKRDIPRESLKAIDEGIELIEKGFSLMIFPEGTRSRGPVMGEFKRGSVKLATKPGVPIIPVSINGSYGMYEETGVFRAAEISVMVHPPIETNGLSRKEEKDLTGKVERIVRDGVEQMQQKRIAPPSC